MSESISLKEVLASIVRQGKKILCFALATAILLGSIQLILQIVEANKPENSKETLDKKYQTALTTYQEKLDEYNKDLKTMEKKLEYQQNYNDNSIVMRLDPYNVAVDTTVLAVTGVDEIIQQAEYAEKNVTPSYFTSKIQDIYELYWNSLILTKNLKDHNYVDVEEKYLRELVTFEVTDSGTFTITVLGETEEDASLLGDAIYSCLMDIHPMIEQNTFKHGLSVINRTTKTEVNTTVESRQNSGENSKESYEKKIKEIKGDISALAKPEKSSSYKFVDILINTLKGIIIGAIGGIVLAILAIVFLYIIGDRVSSSRQMEQLIKVAFIGSLSKDRSRLNCFAEKLLNERSWEDPIQASAFVAENLRTAVTEADSLAVVSTLNLKDMDEALESVVETASKLCSKVCSVKNAEKNPETITAFQESRCVVLAERLGVSKVSEMLSLLEMAKRMNVTVVGFVII